MSIRITICGAVTQEEWAIKLKETMEKEREKELKEKADKEQEEQSLWNLSKKIKRISQIVQKLKIIFV